MLVVLVLVPVFELQFEPEPVAEAEVEAEAARQQQLEQLSLESLEVGRELVGVFVQCGVLFVFATIA